jgi:carboxypeptidase family protein
MGCRSSIALTLLGLLPLAAQAQQPVRAPGGTLTGVVRDSATGLPVGYALVVVTGHEQRVFATESGKFTLTGLGGGTLALRVQQIGYRAVSLTVSVDARSGAGAGTPGLVVTLARQAFVLPQIVVQGDFCTGAPSAEEETGTILDEAFRNAERLLTLERAYPFRVTYQKSIMKLDSTYSRTGGWVDTLRYESRYRSYHRGQVLVRDGKGPYSHEVANYFTASDVATQEFRESHCFWYAGRDSVDGFPGYRIDFAPTAATHSVDWAGSLLIDSVTMTLLRSEAHLVNLPAKGTSFRSALCTWIYKQLLPTLVLEFQARCAINQSGNPPGIVVERWLLIDHAFLGKRPDAPEPPG